MGEYIPYELEEELLGAEAPCWWFPKARRYGQSLRVGSLAGEPGSSLWICLNTGAWLDHATGEKGNSCMSLYAAMKGVSQGRAFRELSGKSPETAAPVRDIQKNATRDTEAEEQRLIIEQQEAHDE